MTAAMNQDIAAILARHEERLDSQEEGQKRIEGKLDKLLFGMLGTLVTALAGLLALLLKHG
jgi:hypothetical protein